MSRSSQQPESSAVFQYIDTLLNEQPQGEAAIIPVDHAGEPEVNDVMNDLAACANEGQAYLLAGIGRFQILIEKSVVSRLLRFDQRMINVDKDEDSCPLYEIRSYLQGREWKEFNKVEKGYCLALKGGGGFIKKEWLLYLDTVKNITRLLPQSIHPTRLTAKWPWVSAVAAQPFRLCLDVQQLEAAVINGCFKSMQVAYTE